MTAERRRKLLSAWLGLSLAALFLYPLAVTLDGNIYYLQWQRSHSVEAVVALIGLAAGFGLVVHQLGRLSGRRAALAWIALAALPLASFGVGIARQLPLREALIPLWERRAISLSVPTAAGAVAMVALLAWPAAVQRALWRTLLILSPVSLVVVQSVVASGFTAGPPLTTGSANIATSRPTASGGQPRCASVLAFLFDELSYSYIYEGGEVRRDFPAIRRFASTATNYAAVSAPARETLFSLPAFLAGRRPVPVQIAGRAVREMLPSGQGARFDATAPDGLFGTARRLGFTTEMAGYYFAYCDLLGASVDVCRSFSFYNTATADAGFSPIHPLLTTAILWPRQFPFGLLKNRPFAAHQRHLVEETMSFALRPVPPDRPIFRFVHFSVPHLPFAFGPDGYDPASDPLRTSPDTAYFRQTMFVDRLLERLLEPLRRSDRYDTTAIVVLSDHGYRFHGRERDPLQIPFIGKRAGQTARIDVSEAGRGEVLLKRFVETACESAKAGAL
jgi:hypothetical protein